MKRLLTILASVCVALVVNAQQHKLWYSKPAAQWLEALPIGNSHLGAMVYGGIGTEQIQLNEETFWSGSPHNNNNPDAKTSIREVRRLGDLMLSFDYQNGVEPSNYRRELNLGDALCTTSFDVADVKYIRTAFASQADNAIIIQLTASKKKALNFGVSYQRNQQAVEGGAVAKNEHAYMINNVEQT